VWGRVGVVGIVFQSNPTLTAAHGKSLPALSKSQETCISRFSIAAMKFFMFWLISSVFFVVAPAGAQANNVDLSAQVLGVYFAPNTDVAAAVVKVIDASDLEVLVQAYGFTHNGIAQALVRAHQRGVRVCVLLDQKSQTLNQYVIGLLSEAHMALRFDGKHVIAHNKVMVVDRTIVITGSFNFTNSAATRNAENLLVLKSPELAHTYRLQWQNHWAHSREQRFEC
jgi:phosphatidylserine/phosphatidylglycerophosphate/cardiolipin synthase-like enzyme